MNPTRRIIVDDSQLQILRPSNMKAERDIPSFLAEPIPEERLRLGRMGSRPSSRNDHQPSPYRHGLDGSVATTQLSRTSSQESHETHATSMLLLAPLQTKGPIEDFDDFDPLEVDDPKSYDLVQPSSEREPQAFSLEARSGLLFSREHLEIIFDHPTLLIPFTAYLSNTRPQSVPILVYYLDAVKALKAIAYANAVTEALEPIPGHDFTSLPVRCTLNSILEDKASRAFDVLVNEDLPAYITHQYIKIVSLNLTRRVTGTLAPHLREASEGLAEVFCLSDPSRKDNPIIFASEEFHRTTQYGMSYAIGRNCRFLQGPNTDRHSVRRLKEAVVAGREHSEVFLNYRRDGSPFMNLLMIAPLCDSRGKIRYFIGAQVDVSGLVKNCTEMESLQRLVLQKSGGTQSDDGTGEPAKKDEFKELSEMLNSLELQTVQRWGGRMHREQLDDDEGVSVTGAAHKPRLLLKDSSDTSPKTYNLNTRGGGVLSGVFQHYLLIRPHPSLRILFASPSLRVPGILQSPFMNKIGGSARVRDDLTAALAEGRGVTAKVRWVTRYDEKGRNRWIHCTPLIGSNGHIGVWMIVVIDEENSLNRRWKQAPPVEPSPMDNLSGPSAHRRQGDSLNADSVRSSSPYSL